MKHKIEAWVYDAEVHCPDCALQRFGNSLADVDTVDREGNPLGTLYSWDWTEFGSSMVACGDCHDILKPSSPLLYGIEYFD